MLLTRGLGLPWVSRSVCLFNRDGHSFLVTFACFSLVTFAGYTPVCRLWADCCPHCLWLQGKLGRSWLTGSDLSGRVSSCKSPRVQTIRPLGRTALLLAGSATRVLVQMARVVLVASHFPVKQILSARRATRGHHTPSGLNCSPPSLPIKGSGLERRGLRVPIRAALPSCLSGPTLKELPTEQQRGGRTRLPRTLLW